MLTARTRRWEDWADLRVTSREEHTTMLRSLLSLATAILISLAGLAALAGDLSDVTKGMTEEKVRSLLGEPDDANSYPTWKRFVPRMGRWSNDRKRMDWVYHDKGRIVFSYNRYTHMYKVLKVTPGGATEAAEGEK